MKDDCISRQAVIARLNQAAENWNIAEPYHEGMRAGFRNAARIVLEMPSAQTELIEKAAYIRGFEQGRTQGMIDSQGGEEMNKQRKVVVTTTYNEMGIIIDTKAEEVEQPKQTDCEYCHEDFDGYVRPIEKNSHAFIRFGMNGWELSLKANGWHGSAKIRYCPMCGRDLFVKRGRKAGENE